MEGFNPAVLDMDPMFKAVQVVKKSVQLVKDPDIRYHPVVPGQIRERCSEG